MAKAIERVFILVILGVVILVLLLFVGCAQAAYKQPTKPAVKFAPSSCITVVKFGQTCQPNTSGYICNRVQLAVNPDPACNEFNTRILRVHK